MGGFKGRPERSGDPKRLKIHVAPAARPHGANSLLWPWTADPRAEAVRELTLKYTGKSSLMLIWRLHEPIFKASSRAATCGRRMAALAARFPGALREIDGLELEEIRRRIRQLEAVVLDEGSVQSWMLAIDLFHRLTRGALSAKSWLRGQKRIDAGLQRAYAAEDRTMFAPFRRRRSSQWTAGSSRVSHRLRGAA